MNVKVCLILPDVALRLTEPVRALVVEKDTEAEVAFAGMVSDAGIVNAGLLAFNVITVGKVWDVASETTHVPEAPVSRRRAYRTATWARRGVKAPGEKWRSSSLPRPEWR